MNFKYEYVIKTSDLWQVSMYYAYSSYLAVINVVCIISSVVLIFKMWGTASMWFKIILLIFLLLFTVIQPIVIYMKSYLKLRGKPRNIKLSFREKEIIICADSQSQSKSYKDIRAIVKKPTLLIIYMEDGNGYVLRNSVTCGTKQDFYEYVRRMISK